MREFFVLDASVLIDLNATEPSVVASISKHVGTLHVASTLLAEEVPDLTSDDCHDLGIRVIDPDLDLLREAVAKILGLSFHDRVCLLLAERNKWTCLTNDAKLRRECKKRSISHQWGLEPVVALVASGNLDRASAKRLMGALQARSPGHYKETIVARFLKAIGAS